MNNTVHKSHTLYTFIERILILMMLLVTDVNKSSSNLTYLTYFYFIYFILYILSKFGRSRTAWKSFGYSGRPPTEFFSPKHAMAIFPNFAVVEKKEQLSLFHIFVANCGGST